VTVLNSGRAGVLIDGGSD